MGTWGERIEWHGARLSGRRVSAGTRGPPGGWEGVCQAEWSSAGEGGAALK